MITVDSSVFPSNIIALMVARTPIVIDAQIAVKTRALVFGDPFQAVSYVPANWSPKDYELSRGISPEPNMQTYTIAIQGMITAPSQEVGVSQHSKLSSLIRNMIYRDAGFRTGIASMVATDSVNGVTERVQRWGIRTVQYVSREINEKFVFLSVSEFWADTQIS